MSSNFEVQRLCEFCKNEFTARTTKTGFCSKKFNAAFYKSQIRNEKISESNQATQRIKTASLDVIKCKEFLTVREVALLLNCSVRSVYKHIENGKIKAFNLSQRITRVKRCDIDQLIDKASAAKSSTLPAPKYYEIAECYTTEEVRAKYGISQSTLRSLVIKHSIPKLSKNKVTYLPKEIINKILNPTAYYGN